MIERIIEAIGTFLSKLFGKVDDMYYDAKTKVNMTKEQVDNIAITAKGSLCISPTTNYFKNRVIGEFLSVIAKLVDYRLDPTTGKYVAYFVRHKNKSTMEYIKFTKLQENADNADVSYTYINKVLSKNGVTTEAGSTKDTVLTIDDAMAMCIYDSLSGSKAPLYLVYELESSIGVGDPDYIYNCWLSVTNLIKLKVDNYINDIDSKETTNKDIALIERLMNKAGAHYFMSYFNSTRNPYYRVAYSKTKVEELNQAIVLYNSMHFNTNKIIGLEYDNLNKTPPTISKEENKNVTCISYMGLTIKYTGDIAEVGERAVSRFNYKLAECLLKSEDITLMKNFLFYVFSTGGIYDEDIVSLKEQSKVKDSKHDGDLDVSRINTRVEPVLKEVMKSSEFREDDNGDLVSSVFESTIETVIHSNESNPVYEVPKPSSIPLDAAIHYEPTIPEAIVKHEPQMEVQTIISDKVLTANNPIEILRATTGEEQSSIKPVNNKPLTSWDLKECREALEGNVLLPQNISKSDLIDRLTFLIQSGRR